MTNIDKFLITDEQINDRFLTTKTYEEIKNIINRKDDNV